MFRIMSMNHGWWHYYELEPLFSAEKQFLRKKWAEPQMDDLFYTFYKNINFI